MWRYWYYIGILYYCIFDVNDQFFVWIHTINTWCFCILEGWINIVLLSDYWRSKLQNMYRLGKLRKPKNILTLTPSPLMHIHTYTHTHARTHAHSHTHTHTCTHTHTSTHTHTHLTLVQICGPLCHKVCDKTLTLYIYQVQRLLILLFSVLFWILVNLKYFVYFRFTKTSTM